MRTDNRSVWTQGFRDGFPIAMGYYAVAFSLGIIAASCGLTAFSGFVSSFLYYVPYVTLAVMTFPAITEVTETTFPGLAALATGLVAAWKGWGLFPVSILCCVVVFVCSLFG